MLVIKDFATTILASALTAAATSVVVSDAGRLPALSAGDYYYLVLQKFTDRTSVEVVKVTGAAGNTLTVVRAQAGTTAKSFAIGDYAEQRVTVGTFSEYIAQSVAGKVDKSGGYVEQSLGLLNTGDLVKATVGISYDVTNGHGTILSGGEGANKRTPHILLRPLGMADASVQALYDTYGSFFLSGGTRYLEAGRITSKHDEDALGWPNNTPSSASNFCNMARQRILVGNNGLFFIADAGFNARRFGIQAGHGSQEYTTSYGTLDLNPYGGVVRVNGGTVYHTNYVPTPAAVGALALSGGVLTGTLDQNIAGYGVRLTASSGYAYLQGGKVGGDNADQKLRISGIFGNPLTEFDILTAGHGIARVNGARIYTEQYVPTPDVLGVVPQARTINSKPLTSNITLSAADVGAAPSGYGLGGYAASIPGNNLNTGLRTASGFYNAPLADNRPAWPMAGTHTWDYVFNNAHGNLAGYNGMIAMDFYGKGLAFKAIHAGADMGWNYVYHTGFKPTAADVGAVPQARTINTKPLTSDVVLSAADVGAVNKAGDAMTGSLEVRTKVVLRDADGIAKATFGIGSDSDIFIHNAISEKYLQLKEDGSLQYSNNRIYHEGFKPTAADVGAVSKAGDTMTGGLTFVNAASELGWVFNTDYAKIGFKNDSDYDSDSYMWFKTGDNGDEYFKWQTESVGGATTDWMSLKSTGLVVAAGVTAPTFTGALAGNAATATKLATARQINGTDFDGSGNITTANWGTARTLTIGNAGKSVNGADNVSWSLNEIGAAAVVDNRIVIPAMNGELGATLKNQRWGSNETDKITWLTDKPDHVAGHKAIGIGTLAGPVYWNGTGERRIYNEDFKPNADDVGALPSGGTAVAAAKLATARTIGGVSFDGTANINLPGVNTTGNQSTTGNAATATKLATARTIAGVSFDGTANISLTAANVGAAPSGYGLGTYGTSISTVLGDCNLRRQSGFFQGSNIAGIPNGTGWTYLFNQAHGNAAGYFGYLAINFAGTRAWIGGQEGGTQKGPYELVKQRDRFVANNAIGSDYHQCAIEVNGNTAIDSRPGVGFHMSGRFAGTLHLWEAGDFRFHTQGLASYAGIMAGNVNANDVYIRSDRRLKKNLVEVRDALRKVSSLTAYSYDKKQTLEAAEYDKKEVGLIAQDVEQVLPEAVTRVVDSSNKDGTEILTLSNSALIALLVEAVKELSEKVKELEHGRT